MKRAGITRGSAQWNPCARRESGQTNRLAKKTKHTRKAITPRKLQKNIQALPYAPPETVNHLSGLICQRSLRPLTPLGLGLRRTLRPLPQPARDRQRESVAQGPGDQHDLAAVVRLVGHEIGQHVPYVERKIAPGVGRSPRDPAISFTAEGE